VEVHSELKLVTCLFVDIVGSTEATIRLGPERMQRLLSDGFAQISGTIRAHGGVVEKYIGDAILGTFGIPIARPDDAERALRAAEACTAWARAWAAGGGLAVRAGLESGDLLVDPRATETQQRMVIGEAINLAARLQAHAEPGQVIVGPGCHEATAGVARFASLGALELKGLGEVEAWRFESFGETAAESDLEFVGREPELAELRGAFDRARGGAPALALIVGPPGQGKSRLAREVIRRSDGFRVLEARCRPGTEAGANTPLRQLIEAEVGEASASSVAERMRVLLDEADASDIASAVSHGAGIAVDDRLLAISRYEQRELIARAWERYMARVTVDGSLALLVEDVHWADPLLLRVLDYVTSTSAGSLLVVATARPEFVGTALRPGEGRIQIDLGPLDDDAAARLAEAVAGATERVGASVDRAGGNPLFLIELARAQTAQTRLPVNVQAAIAARLDELEPDERTLIQHASVAGETFDLRAAAVLADREPSAVVAAIARVAQLGFILPAGSGYRFHHALVRDVVYGRLPVAERMALHARYATEGVDAADLEARAHHWWEALKPPDASWVWEDGVQRLRLREEAYRIHLAAADRAVQHNAQELGLEFAQRAVELADTLSARARAEAAVGAMFARQGRGDEAWAHRNTALDLFGDANETPPATVFADMLQPATFNWGWFHDLPSDEQVLGLLAEGERVARATDDDVSLAMLLAEHASYTEDLAGTEEIHRFLSRPDPVPFADAAQRMATVFTWSGRIKDAVALFEDVFDRLIPAGAHINTSEALAWYGMAAVTAGDLERARRLVTELDIDSEHRSVHTRSHYFSVQALVRLGTGDWSGLHESASRIRDLADLNPDVSFCLLSAATVGYGGVGEVLAGRPLPADIDAQLKRQVNDSEVVRAAAALLPKVMAGDIDALADGLRGYAPGLGLWDRYRVWDVTDVMPAIALAILERWEDLGDRLSKLDEFSRQGARLAGAVADAIREEQRAARGGPSPTHEALHRLGFGGFSEILRFRPHAVDRAA
jgi:class 3 adenylate cyclase